MQSPAGHHKLHINPQKLVFSFKIKVKHGLTKKNVLKLSPVFSSNAMSADENILTILRNLYLCSFGLIVKFYFYFIKM